MPAKNFPSAESAYKLGNIFQITRPKDTDPSIEILTIKVTKTIEVANKMNPQSFLAQVEEGPNDLSGKTVFIKVYDPLYVNPDHLKTICTFPLRMLSNSLLGPDDAVKHPESSGSSDSSITETPSLDKATSVDGSTLADPVEWPRQAKPVLLPAIEEALIVLGSRKYSRLPSGTQVPILPPAI